MSDQGEFERIPAFTQLVLDAVPHYPTIGLVAALIILLVAVSTFRFSTNEDTRLQVVLGVSLLGYTLALQLTLAVGIGLVLLPAMANGI